MVLAASGHRQPLLGGRLVSGMIAFGNLVEVLVGSRIMALPQGFAVTFSATQ